MFLFLKLIFRQFIYQNKFSFLFILNLSIGFFSFYLVESFKSSVSESVLSQSKGMTGGDLVISSRQLIREEQKAKALNILPENTKQSSVLRVFSMTSFDGVSRLIQLKAIEEQYPFYGVLELKGQGVVNSELKNKLIQEDIVWISQDLEIQLGLKPGDILNIGQAQFRVDDVIKNDSSVSFAGLAFAPQVYFSNQSLEKTKLLQLGSTLTQKIIYQLPEGEDADYWSSFLQKNILDSSIRVQSYKDDGEGSARVLKYLGDFLGLVSIVTLCLSSLGIVFLLRSLLIKKRKEIGILLSLGWSQKNIFLYFSFLLLFYSFISSVFSFSLVGLFLPYLQTLLAGLTPYQLELKIPLLKVVIVFFLGPVFCFLVCLPFLLGILQSKPLSLFSSTQEPENLKPLKTLVYWLPAFFFSFALAFWQAPSFKLSFGFMGLFWLSALVAGFIAYLLLYFMRDYKPHFSFAFRFSFLGLTRHRYSTVLSFIALTLGALLVNILPQLENSLKHELKVKDEAQMLPSLFLFDIQEDQVQDLKNFLLENGITIQNLSPMVRARLLSVNNKEFESNTQESSALTREEEAELRFRNRGVNLTYRESLNASESITDGEWLGSKDSDLPWASVEQRYAERLGLKLGDELVFDIQGVEVNAQIKSLRRVDWTTFSPNFFILLNPVLLKDAPKSFLASLTFLEPSLKNRMQKEMVSVFPNISMIDVAALVSAVINLSQGALFALFILSWLTVFVGFIVLYSIGQFQAESKKSSYALLKVLGLSQSKVIQIITIEFLLLGFFCSFIGSFLGFFISMLIHFTVFESVFVPLILWPFLVCLFFIIASFFIGIFVGTRVNQESPQKLLWE